MQGDPISPAIFALALDGFSELINDRINKGHIRPYVCKCVSMPILHIMYADDMIL